VLVQLCIITFNVPMSDPVSVEQLPLALHIPFPVHPIVKRQFELNVFRTMQLTSVKIASS